MLPVKTSDHDGVRVLTLSRPPVNAMDLSLVRALHEALLEAEESAACRALVMTGEGPAFCAGIDVKALPAYGPEERREMIRGINRAIRALYALPKPTVAAVNGHALGGGHVLILGCDLRLAAEGSYRLGLAEITAGVPFPAAALAVVKAELDHNTARSLVLTGRVFGPVDPTAATFLDGVCPPDRLLADAIERARQAAGLTAYGAIKRQLKAETLQRLQEIVEQDDDPMLQAWF